MAQTNQATGFLSQVEQQLEGVFGDYQAIIDFVLIIAIVGIIIYLITR